jgi:hypothetical protein
MRHAHVTGVARQEFLETNVKKEKKKKKKKKKTTKNKKQKTKNKTKRKTPRSPPSKIEPTRSKNEQRIKITRENTKNLHDNGVGGPKTHSLAGSIALLRASVSARRITHHDLEARLLLHSLTNTRIRTTKRTTQQQQHNKPMKTPSASFAFCRKQKTQKSAVRTITRMQFFLVLVWAVLSS